MVTAVGTNRTRQLQDQQRWYKHMFQNYLSLLLVQLVIICSWNGDRTTVPSSGGANSRVLVSSVVHATTSYSNVPTASSSTNPYDCHLNNNNVEVNKDASPVELETNQPSRIPWIRFKDSNNQHLQFDFSGRVCTHVIGPHALLTDDTIQTTGTFDDAGQPLRNTAPLMDVDLENNWYQPLYPSIFLTTHYDFTKCWYGIRQLGITFQFRGRQLPAVATSSVQSLLPSGKSLMKNDDTQQGTTKNNFVTRVIQNHVCPTWIGITKEYPMRLTKNSAQSWGTTSSTILNCQWSTVHAARSLPYPTDENCMDFVSLQFQKRDSPASKVFETALLKIPLQQRIRLECHLINQDSLPVSPEVFCTQRKQPVHHDDENDEWWIPNVRINALGLMESNNYMSFQKQNLAFTLSLRRRLNWSALGWLGVYDNQMHDSGQTRIQLRMQHRNKPQTLSSMLEITSQVERPFETVSMLLRQDVAIVVAVQSQEENVRTLLLLMPRRTNTVTRHFRSPKCQAQPPDSHPSN